MVMGLAAAGALAQSAAPAPTPGSPAAPLPDWAYPANPPVAEFDAKEEKTLPGSSRKYTQAQVENDLHRRTGFPKTIRRCHRSSPTDARQP